MESILASGHSSQCSPKKTFTGNLVESHVFEMMVENKLYEVANNNMFLEQHTKPTCLIVRELSRTENLGIKLNPRANSKDLESN